MKMSETSKRFAWTVAVATATLGIFIGLGQARSTEPSLPAPAPWAVHIQVMDAALERGDVEQAARARHDAYRAALASRRWEALADVGDATLRLAARRGVGVPTLAEARRLYLSALFRARRERSLAGVLRATEAFAALGDRDVARQGLLIAASLARDGADPELLARMQALRERVQGRSPASSPGQGSGVTLGVTAGLGP
ncbi:MAG TPA: hypothetical protein VFN71_07845 [Methylomirabilota bacterium]|nr:hypothetical protein [Methylomirabilota bacterium]